MTNKPQLSTTSLVYFAATVALVVGLILAVSAAQELSRAAKGAQAPLRAASTPASTPALVGGVWTCSTKRAQCWRLIDGVLNIADLDRVAPDLTIWELEVANE